MQQPTPFKNLSILVLTMQSFLQTVSFIVNEQTHA